MILEFLEFHQRGVYCGPCALCRKKSGEGGGGVLQLQGRNKAWKEQRVQHQKEVVDDRETTNLSAMEK